MKATGATASRIRPMILGMFGGYAAYRLFRQMVSTVSEQEATLAQMRAGLTSTNGVSGQTIRSLTQLSAEMQRLTNYSNETVEASEAIMLSLYKHLRRRVPARDEGDGGHRHAHGDRPEGLRDPGCKGSE
jgi:hypothetical protein